MDYENFENIINKFITYMKDDIKKSIEIQIMQTILDTFFQDELENKLKKIRKDVLGIILDLNNKKEISELIELEIFDKDKNKNIILTISNQIKKNKNYLKDISSFLNSIIKEYLLINYNKYSKIKTFFHRHEPIFLYNVFYPPKLITYENKVINTKEVRNIFFKDNCISVIGDAGSGKSTLVKHLFINSLSTNFRIPILLELRYFNRMRKIDFEYFFLNQIQNGLDNNKRLINTGLTEVIKLMLKLGKFIFFIDGYDEIKSTKRTKVLTTFENFICQYEDNYFIITSRPFSGIETFSRFYNYYMRKLYKNDILAFIRKQNVEKEFEEKLIKSINNPQIKHILPYLKNPLMLSLYMYVFDRTITIPQNKSQFYQKVFDTLYYEFDAQFKKFKRERKSKLNQTQFEYILIKFSTYSFFNGVFDFEREYILKVFNMVKRNIDFSFNNEHVLDDFLLGIAIWVDDEGKITFLHRSLQEYFAAKILPTFTDNIKKEFYIRIKKGILSDIHFDSNNFLSLCYEIDKIAVIEFLIFPTLNEIKNIIQNKKDESFFWSLFSFLLFSFRIKIIINKYNKMTKVFDISVKITYALNNENMMHIKVYQGKIFHFIDRNVNKILLLFKKKNPVLTRILTNCIDEYVCFANRPQNNIIINIDFYKKNNENVNFDNLTNEIYRKVIYPSLKNDASVFFEELKNNIEIYKKFIKKKKDKDTKWLEKIF